jgi:methylated-DNA-[protein]-cysteine S-methyltransferase
MLHYVIFKTGFGWIGALASSQGLVKTTFPQKSRESALSLLTLEKDELISSDEIFGDLIEFYKAYFAGQKTVYSGKLDFSKATGFQRKVWEAAWQIPYGETRSYSSLAKSIGNPLACRAVGNALGKNPLPIIIPCHRVIGADGCLGGFGGGLDMKRRLLKLESQT